jgi:hypothetical protein
MRKQRPSGHKTASYYVAGEWQTSIQSQLGLDTKAHTVFLYAYVGLPDLANKASGCQERGGARWRSRIFQKIIPSYPLHQNKFKCHINKKINICPMQHFETYWKAIWYLLKFDLPMYSPLYLTTLSCCLHLFIFQPVEEKEAEKGLQSSLYEYILCMPHSISCILTLPGDLCVHYYSGNSRPEGCQSPMTSVQQ